MFWYARVLNTFEAMEPVKRKKLKIQERTGHNAEKGIQVTFEGNGPGCRQPLGSKICCRQVKQVVEQYQRPRSQVCTSQLANRFYFFWQLSSLGRGVERMGAGHCLFWLFRCRKVNRLVLEVGTRKSATPLSHHNAQWV